MFKVVVAGAIALALGGCATVTRGTSDQIQVNSDPPQAVVTTSMNHQCVTPCTFTVQRKDEFTVNIQKAGYEPQSVFVATRVAGSGAAGFAGNVLLGGVIGMGVDATSGATLEHFPNPVTFVLQPVRGPAGPPGKRGRTPPIAATRPPPAALPPSGIATEPEPQLSDRDVTMNRRN
jgi:membrane-bound inhibitor of C-type lysozyme